MEAIFDSDALPAGERVQAWVEITALALVTTRFKLLDEAAFGARLRAMPLGAAQLTELSYGPLLSQRTPAMIRRSDPEHYQVAVIRSGRQRIEQARTGCLLRPGDMVLYDSSRPFDATVPDGQSRAQSLLLQFPKRLLPLPEAKVARLLAVPLPASEGVGRLLARFVSALADEHGQCAPKDGARLGNTALDLVTTVLAHCLDERPAPARPPHDVLFLRAVSFIQQHLGSPELVPAAIAAAHRVSTRHLHRVFQRHGTSVSAYVREARLERCRRDLADPRLRHLTVQAIAGRWGFPRPADFTRAFRSAVGMPPTQYRAAAQSAGPATPPTAVPPPGPHPTDHG